MHRDTQQHDGQQEGDAPAPLVHCVGFLAAQNEEHARDHERPRKETAGRGGRDEAGIDASPRGRCVFSQEGAGAGVLAGGREALDHAQNK